MAEERGSNRRSLVRRTTLFETAPVPPLRQVSASAKTLITASSIPPLAADSRVQGSGNVVAIASAFLTACMGERAMFLTCWSPRSSKLSGTRSRTCSNTALDMTTLPGSASASNRAAMFTPSRRTRRPRARSVVNQCRSRATPFPAPAERSATGPADYPGCPVWGVSPRLRKGANKAPNSRFLARKTRPTKSSPGNGSSRRKCSSPARSSLRPRVRQRAAMRDDPDRLH